MGVDCVNIDPRHARLMTPGGTRDFLPPDAARKLALERALQRTFRAWGYARVITPTVEHLQTVVQSNGQSVADKMYRLFDREGHTLALRPEVTTSIARIAATRLRDELPPIRVHYIANVFRHEPLQAGRQREFWQAGVELIGASGPVADAEIVALAAAALRAGGLGRFRIDIGHVGYFNGLLNELGLDKEARHRLRRALLQRDYVGFTEALHNIDRASAKTKALLQLPKLRGGQEAIERAAALAGNEESERAAADVQAIYDVLVSHGVADVVQVDFGMIKDLDYYTGMVLEGYTDGIGFPVCTGGRYDNLIGRFGYDITATGFVLGVERLMSALSAQGHEWTDADAYSDWLIAADKDGLTFALRAAEKLRAKGLIVEVDVMQRDIDTLLAYAGERRIEHVAFVSAEQVRLFSAPSYEPRKAVQWP